MKLRAIIPLLVIGISFTACKRDQDVDPPVYERSYMHILNLHEGDSVDITFDYWNADDVVIHACAPGRNWPLNGYADLLEGGQPDQWGNGKIWLTVTRHPTPPVTSFDTLGGPKDVLLDPLDRQSLFLIDSADKVLLITADDSFTAPTDSGKANFRFVNGRETSPKLTFRSTDGSVVIPGVDFKTVSTFQKFNSGTYDFEVVDDATGTVVATFNAFWVGEGGTYTLAVRRSSSVIDFYLN